jgi:DNA-binding XRE family transcriptional regulator
MLWFMQELPAGAGDFTQTVCDVLRVMRDYTPAELIEIGQVLGAARKTAGLNQVDVANAVEVDQATISRIERGLAQPSAPLLFRIAECVGADTAPNTDPFISKSRRRPTRRRRPELAAAS